MTKVDRFERVAFDGTRVLADIGDGRANIWVRGAEWLGTTSAAVAILFMGEVAIYDRAELAARLADCRRAKSVIALRGIQARRAAREADDRARADIRNHAADCNCRKCGDYQPGYIGVTRIRPRSQWVPLSNLASTALSGAAGHGVLGAAMQRVKGVE